MIPHHRHAPDQCQFSNMEDREIQCLEASEYVIFLNINKCPTCGSLPALATCERHAHLALERLPPDVVNSVRLISDLDNETPTHVPEEWPERYAR